MFEIPGYPEICRVCLVKLDSADAVSLDTTVRDGADSYGKLMEQILSSHRIDQITDHTQLPTHICTPCRQRLDEWCAFQLETSTNDLLLNAWLHYDRNANINPLSDLLNPQSVHHGTVERTLNRLDVLKGRSMDDLLNELLHPEIKVEIDIYESVLEPVQDDEPSLKSDSEDDQDDEDFCARKKVDQVKKNRRTECLLENCTPLAAGQKMGQHIRELHRAYCKICGLVFQKNAHVMHHMAIHKSDELRFRCDLCERPFWREGDMNLHRKEFHGLEVEARECPYCEERFKTVVQMVEHREVHKTCKFCERGFVSYKIVLQHMRASHVDRLHSCKICSVTFLGKQEYETHLQKHRDGIKENSVPFTRHGWTGVECVTCERTYFNGQYFTDHLQKDHTNGIAEKPKRTTFHNKRTKEETDQLEYKFPCPHCPARFKFKSSLKGHIQKNHLGITFICEHCGVSFKSKPALKLHERYRHKNETPFPCEFCEKRCHTKTDLAIHRRTHTNEKPYACSHAGCEKAYKTQSALVKHVRYHTGERPYRCSFEGCEKAYACSQLLKAHVRVHTLEKPYKCWYCEELFSTNNNRVKHSKRHHVGRPIGREYERMMREQQQQQQQEQVEQQ